MHNLSGSAGAQANVLQTQDGHPGETDKLCLACKHQHVCIVFVHCIFATKSLLRQQICFGLQASREHYCIHPTVSKKASKDEECQNMLKDDPGCKFFKNVNKLYSMQSSHFLMVCYLINSNLVLCILDLLLSPCTLCNTYLIHVLLLAPPHLQPLQQTCVTPRYSGVLEASLHNKLETRRVALLLSAGA